MFYHKKKQKEKNKKKKAKYHEWSERGTTAGYNMEVRLPFF